MTYLTTLYLRNGDVQRHEIEAHDGAAAIRILAKQLSLTDDLIAIQSAVAIPVAQVAA